MTSLFSGVWSNEDCLSAFETGSDKYDIVSTGGIIISIACNALFHKLLVNNVLENIDKIPVWFSIPESDKFDTIIPIDPNNDSTSNRSEESDNESNIDSLDKYIKQFIITHELCNDKLKLSKTLQIISVIVIIKEL